MPEFIIDNPAEIDFGASGLHEIYQNIRVIISTLRGTVPLNREFGIDSDIIDRPIPVARALFADSIVEALNRWEPRIRVTDVRWAESAEQTIYGLIRPIISFELI